MNPATKDTINLVNSAQKVVNIFEKDKGWRMLRFLDDTHVLNLVNQLKSDIKNISKHIRN